MSSNTNLGNTPVNQGYVQLIHTGETGGIDGTLRILYDGDGTASDLQIASNKVKVSTELFIGSKTLSLFIQDTVGAMFSGNTETNIDVTYQTSDNTIDLVATGAITGLTGGTGIDITGSGSLTIAIDSTVATKSYVDTEVAGIVDSAPGTLDTLNELAAALGDDANFSTTTATNIATKLAKASNLSDLTNASTARSNLGVDAAGTDNSTNVTLVTTSHDYLSLSGQAITLGTIDISDDTNLVGGTGITLTGDTLSTTDSEIVHDNLSGFVANEHKDHSAININTAAGSGLTGGGDITTTRSISVDVNNLDAQLPALELADKIAIYDNSATETNVATLTQLKAIVNTDTNTNQLTTFDVSGDSGTDQTISHGNTLTISGGNGISTSTSATDILSVALGGFSSLTSQSSPDEQDLVVIEEAIGGAIKKVQIGALTSGISFNGSTANGLLTYGSSTTADVESNLTFDASNVLTATDGSESMAYTPSNNYLTIHETGATKGSHLRLATDNSDFILTAGGSANQLSLYDVNGIANRLVVNSSGRFQFQQDISIPVAKKLYFGGGDHTYIGEDADDRLRFFVGGDEFMRFTQQDAGGEIFSIYKDVYVADDKTIHFGGGNDIKIYHNSSSGNANIENYTGSLYVTNYTDNADIILRSDDGSGGVTPYITLDGSTGHLNLTPPNNVGIGTSSPSCRLHVSGNQEQVIRFQNGSTSNVQSIEMDSSRFYFYNRTASAFNSISVLNGGNVGIGAITPAYKLDVFGTTRIYSASGDADLRIEGGASNTTSFMIRNGAGNNRVDLLTGGANAMTINSSQNVGIGVTSPEGKVHIYQSDAGVAPHGDGDDLVLESNADTGISILSGEADGETGAIIFGSQNDSFGAALQYNYYENRLKLYTANSGHSLIFATDNNTEAMRIDSSQRVGIGTSSLGAGAKLNVVSGSSAYTAQFSRHDADDGLFLHSEAAGSHYNWLISTQDNVDAGFEITPSTAVGNRSFTTPAFVIKADTGRIGIGTNSPAEKLHIVGNVRVHDGGYLAAGDANDIFIRHDGNGHLQSNAGTMFINQVANGSMIFSTNNTERIRITSAGRVLIGGTSASGHNFDFEVLDNHAYVKGPDGWNGTGDLAIVALGSAVVNEVFGCGYKYGTGMILSTYKTGGYGSFGSSCQDSLIIADTTGQAKFINDVVAFATSDKRLKENVKPLDNALDKINKINGVEFDWIDGKDKHGNSVHSNEGHDIGVIAQEIEEVLPEVVTTRDNGYKAVKYEKIVPLLIQAIKEQQKQIEELKNG